MEPGWTTAEAFFANDTVIEEFLDYEGSFNAGTDRKACGSLMMTDYAYVFALATVPAFLGFAILPDLSPSRFALQFHTTQDEHDGHTHEVRRAHVRYLSGGFCTSRKDHAAHPDGRGPMTHNQIADAFCTAVKAHFEPLIEQLHARTKLSRNAFWRLVADALAGWFIEAGRRLGCLEAAKASAMAVLKRPGSPLNNRQLHYFDLSVCDRAGQPFSHTFRGRGGCCRFYTVEGGEYCSTCVLKDPRQRDDDLRQAMRRHLGLTGAEIA
ncbi:Ferric iron reductase protein FhuF, involved in iron transport [Bosea lathyri]|uniref:Ferric iron reductase protein FhuF, involved in iron transport n=2 Tax=Bosea lathyri TaxID=1036778 RepID=A0A1H5SRF2_9HYPH|nr:Ferric iron reductase protein FhuF, involved in iron transport [Bosea lathyri]